MKKIDFWYSKAQVSKQTWTENFQIFGFCLRETNPPPPKCAILFADYDPVNDGGILAHELVGGQSEMVV